MKQESIKVKLENWNGNQILLHQFQKAIEFGGIEACYGSDGVFTITNMKNAPNFKNVIRTLIANATKSLNVECTYVK